VSNRSTVFGRMLKQGRIDELRAEVTETLVLCEGRVDRSAHWLGICRRQLYRYLYRAELWSVVDAIRICVMMKEPSMDESVMEQICEKYRGKSVEEIAQAIRESKHAPSVPDPDQVAAFIFARCEAG